MVPLNRQIEYDGPTTVCDICPISHKCKMRLETVDSWLFFDQKEICDASQTCMYMSDDELILRACCEGLPAVTIEDELILSIPVEEDRD